MYVSGPAMNNCDCAFECVFKKTSSNLLDHIHVQYCPSNINKITFFFFFLNQGFFVLHQLEWTIFNRWYHDIHPSITLHILTEQTCCLIFRPGQNVPVITVQTQLYTLIREKLDHILWRKSLLVLPLTSSGCSAGISSDLQSILLNRWLYLSLK